jgi:hypothetical protein
LNAKGASITREDRWPAESDLGALVLLPGGEVGTLTSWWNADDGSEWRWQIELYNHVWGGQGAFRDEPGLVVVTIAMAVSLGWWPLHILLLVIGFGVGTYGTLIGAGGGFVLVPILLVIYPTETPTQLTAVSLGACGSKSCDGRWGIDGWSQRPA